MEDSDFIDKILDEVVFERDFYKVLANTDEYDVVAVDANSSSPILASEDFQRKALETQCDRTGVKVLYQISYGTYAVVVCKEGGDLIGIVPELYPDGWPC
ncbi:MAG: hypothetical protein JRI94_19545 [Deltaproteobacteria bacterium]|nr:hypothetical protein [Deltaproteobacteria bacterium]